jgi:mannosyltransferase
MRDGPDTGQTARRPPEKEDTDYSVLYRVATAPASAIEWLSDSVRQAGGPAVTALVAVLVAAVLRLHRLGEESFWLDEAFTWFFVTREYTTLELLTTLPTEDVHPPLYYLLIDGWAAIAGTSEAALRFPSAVFGIATVGMLYLVGAKLFDRWTGAIAAVFLAVSSFHLYYSQEARMYSLLTVLTLLSFYFFIDLVRDRERSGWIVLGYVLASVLLVYTHIYGAFVVVAQNAYLVPWLLLGGRTLPWLGRLDRPALSLRQWLVIEGAIGIAAVPWAVAVLSRVPNVAAGGCSSITWIPEPTAGTLSTMVSRYFFYCGPSSFYGLPISEGSVLGLFFPMLVAVAVGFAAFGLVAHSDSSGFGLPGRAEMLALVWLLIPIAIPFVLSHAVAPIMITRYTIAASLGLFLLIGKGIRSLQPHAPAAVRVAVAGLLVFGMVAPVASYYEEDQKQQWRETVHSVESIADEDALVLVSTETYVPPYQYYADRPDGTITGISDRASRQSVRVAVEDHQSVWLVLSHANRAALVENLRSLNYIAVRARSHQGVQVYHFVRPG